MENKSLENLIIIVLVIAIFYFLFKKENFEEKSRNIRFVEKPQYINYTNQTEIIEQPIEKPEETIQKPEETIQKPEETIQKPEETIQKPEIKNADHDVLTGYDRPEFSEIEKFLKEYREYGRFNNPIEKITSDNEIDAYRSSYIDFRNYTHQDSHGFDAVDNINLEQISKLNSVGMKLSDVYDRITANNYKKNNIDIVGMHHNEKRNDRLRQNEFTYDSDTVNNGGFFFDKVIASDNDNETHMPL